MFKFFNFSKKKKVNLIAERIKALNDKLWLIYITGKENRVDSKVRYFRSNNVGKSEEYKIMSLETYFGERKIAVNNDILYYGNSDLIQESSIDNDWSFNFNFLFYIEIKQEDDIFIKFSDDVNMSKEQIDLAILEFEVVVDKIYTEISKGNKDYDEVVDYLINGA